MEPYQYLPLNEENEEIRILTLHPGSFHSPIRVSLSNVRFPRASTNGGDIPDFEALSYAWGSAENPVDIIVQSPGSGEGSLTVTQNLAAALPYLRYPDKARLIWIDAIAVNQKDLKERSNQVTRMADIYSKARRVVVWLGCETAHTALALDYISAVNSGARVDWARFEIHANSSDKSWTDSWSPPRMEEQEAAALLEFFSSPWFERLWIWQEIQLAPSDATVVCGSLSIPWVSVRNIVFILCNKRSVNSPSGLLLKERIFQIFRLCDGNNYRRLDILLYHTKYCKYTDPRDRIFALLSLLRNDVVRAGIEPDYTKIVLEVYKDAVVRWSTFQNTLTMLESCGLDRRLEGAPSWVPNFMIPDTCHPLGECNASAGAFSVFTSAPRNVLEVLGVSVAQISSIGPIGFPLSTSEDVMLALKNIIDQFLPYDEFPLQGGRFQSMCRVIMSGTCAEQWNPPREDLAPRRDQIFQLVSEIQTTGSFASLTYETHRFLNWIYRWLQSRTVFVTEDGRLGLGPQKMQVGDVVAIFLGKKTATILRPASSPFHEIVGDAYCDGVMDGEALLGPFPGRWERIMVDDRDLTSSQCAFVDRDTGVTQPEDPRLGELPKGWSRKSHENERLWTEFVNESGEVLDKGWDPRLLPEALRERGVNLNFFKLV